MKIGVTGDLHGEVNFPRIYKAKKQGFTHLIVAGDFGYVWTDSAKESKQLDYINKIGIQVLFVDGNHENHDLLNSLPVTSLYGGSVHQIRPNIIHLMRGEVYNIGGKSIFTFGGAKSTDKEYRIEGLSWWASEMPSEQEMTHGFKTLAKHHNKVDYIITHTGYSSAVVNIGASYRVDELTDYLSAIKTLNTFNHWFFGHMHLDTDALGTNTSCVYKDIIEI